MNILFRADAGVDIGSGHLMRCLGLAQYLRDEGTSCTLLTTGAEEPVVVRWREEEIDVQERQARRGSPEDAAAALAAATAGGAQWIVADGYDFGLDWQRVAKEGGAGLLCFDDLGGATFAADLVVNQKPGAQDLSYGMEGDGRVLAGAGYVVLRRDIRRLTREAASTPPHLLVTFGGYDEDNLALAAMRELAGVETPFIATVICSADTDGLAEAQTFAASHADRFRVLPPGDMVPLMVVADLALCAGGTTSLELASLGIPMVLVTVADNQEPGAAALAGAGCARLAGRGIGALPDAARVLSDLLRDAAVCKDMGGAGPALVDGRGVERIARAMHTRTTPS
ncbi:MAG: UDP-2,4-diacetamido-2,4,6-trideoxy-beta-L-altropyranose hydrolase [Alphaproteobacteria bacterium]|jgi:UDP-2,4-diacetamido-2,4,6-trideoxy-beta-L-altropyranose hydrolase|nr:UDP-2,4-diacetamido-2,4,6-trideoxy-beta-L-altropyranose hydrolase [Alphaproteobacteria bacterium]